MSTIIGNFNLIPSQQLPEKLIKSARIRETGVYDGQNAQRNHVLKDKDIIELHFS